MAAAVLVAIFFSMVTTLPFDAGKVTALEAELLVVSEAIYGLALGLIANCIFAVVRLAGRIVEQQMGLDIAQVVDPITGEPCRPAEYAFGDNFYCFIPCCQRPSFAA